MIKKRNMLRHIDISNALVEELLVKIVIQITFKEKIQPEIFKELFRILFMYNASCDIAIYLLHL